MELQYTAEEASDITQYVRGKWSWQQAIDPYRYLRKVRKNVYDEADLDGYAIAFGELFREYIENPRTHLFSQFSNYNSDYMRYFLTFIREELKGTQGIYEALTYPDLLDLIDCFDVHPDKPLTTEKIYEHIVRDALRYDKVDFKSFYDESEKMWNKRDPLNEHREKLLKTFSDIVGEYLRGDDIVGEYLRGEIKAVQSSPAEAPAPKPAAPAAPMPKTFDGMLAGIKEMYNSAREETANLKAEHEEEIDRQEKAHKEEIARLKAEHKVEMATLAEKHKEEMKKLRSDISADSVPMELISRRLLSKKSERAQEIYNGINELLAGKSGAWDNESVSLLQEIEAKEKEERQGTKGTVNNITLQDGAAFNYRTQNLTITESDKKRLITE